MVTGPLWQPWPFVTSRPFSRKMGHSAYFLLGFCAESIRWAREGIHGTDWDFGPRNRKAGGFLDFLSLFSRVENERRQAAGGDSPNKIDLGEIVSKPEDKTLPASLPLFTFRDDPSHLILTTSLNLVTRPKYEDTKTSRRRAARKEEGRVGEPKLATMELEDTDKVLSRRVGGTDLSAAAKRLVVLVFLVCQVPGSLFCSQTRRGPGSMLLGCC